MNLRFSWSRLWDALALLAIGFAIWKFVVMPRTFARAGAHPAPHAVFARLEGPPFRVVDQRGRVLFLDFFASWCEPCKAELPLVERWAAQHRNAVVVPVDVAEPRAVALAFARRLHLGNVALDPSASARAFFNVQGFPTIVVVDPHGDVRATWQGLNPAIGLAMSNAEAKLQ